MWSSWSSSLRGGGRPVAAVVRARWRRTCRPCRWRRPRRANVASPAGAVATRATAATRRRTARRSATCRGSAAWGASRARARPPRVESWPDSVFTSAAAAACGQGADLGPVRVAARDRADHQRHDGGDAPRHAEDQPEEHQGEERHRAVDPEVHDERSGWTCREGIGCRRRARVRRHASVSVPSAPVRCVSRARRGGSRSSRAPRSAGPRGCCRCRGRRRRASGRCATSAPRSRARRRSRARAPRGGRAGGRG